ncbi:hypothetical protein Q5752_003820 [Cryptotrichosporon argae]
MLRPALASARTLSTSAAHAHDVVGTVGAAPAAAPRPVGGFRLFGFLLGFSAATALSIYFLQQDTKAASGLLLASVNELQAGTGRITSHLDRLRAVEKELAALKASAAARDDVGKVRAEMKTVYDGLHREVLDLRAHVWGVEQDLQRVVKTESIRI